MAGAALVMCLAQRPDCLPPDAGFRPDGKPTDRLLWLASIVEHESGPRGPWAVRNETTKQSRWFRTREEAEREALARHSEGHVLGLGPGQITHQVNWVRFGLADAHGRPVHAFNLCRSVAASARHLANDHDRAIRLATFASYNGSGPAARAYALRVDAALARGSNVAKAAPATTVNPCPAGPPEWDAWATARHAARCERLTKTANAARRNPPSPAPTGAHRP